MIGLAIDETGEGGHPPAEPASREPAGATARDYLGALPGDRFPQLVALAEHYGDVDADARFELLLDIFVDGLARRR